MNWRELSGYNWCLLETPETEPIVGLTLGYGLVHEPLTDFGSLQLLAGMLQTELARPIEMSLGRVAVPEVSLHVGTDTFDIRLRGATDTLALAWNRLTEIFDGQHPLDPAQPLEAQVHAAPRDITSRFGMTSLTLAALGDPGLETQPEPLKLLAHLNPIAGNVRAVMYTNTQTLAGTGFTPPTSLPEPARSRYRSTARAGAMHFPRGHVVFSTVVPRTGNGAAAVRVLAQQTAEHLASFTRRDDGVSVSLIPVGPDMLATIMTDDLLTTPQLRSQVQRLLATRPIPDHRVQQAVDAETDRHSMNRKLERKAHGLPDEDPVSVDGTQQALAAARTTLRFFTEPGSSVPEGIGLAQPELPSPAGRVFKGNRKQRLTIGATVIERSQRGANGSPDVHERVDLSGLALVLVDGEHSLGSAVLIDSEFRTVEIDFAAYRNEQALRDMIATIVIGVPHFRVRKAVRGQAATQQVTQQSSGWRWLVLVPVIVAFGVLSSWLSGSDPTTTEAGSEDSTTETEPERVPDTHKVDLAVGETGTTVDWARVTVQEVHQEPVDLGAEYTVAVEYCAAEDGQEVDPEHFRMLHGENTLLAHTSEVSEDALERTHLDSGQCATGNVGFYIAEDDPTQLKVDYRAGDLSSLTRAVKEPGG